MNLTCQQSLGARPLKRQHYITMTSNFSSRRSFVTEIVTTSLNVEEERRIISVFASRRRRSSSKRFVYIDVENGKIQQLKTGQQHIFYSEWV